MRPLVIMRGGERVSPFPPEFEPPTWFFERRPALLTLIPNSICGRTIDLSLCPGRLKINGIALDPTIQRPSSIVEMAIRKKPTSNEVAVYFFPEILKTFVPHLGHLPVTAFRLFFMVTGFTSVLTFFLHFTQYISSVAILSLLSKNTMPRASPF